MNNSFTPTKAVRLFCPILAVAMMILFCDSCQPEKKCGYENGVCKGDCIVPLYDKDGKKVDDAKCGELTIDGKKECKCFLRFTGGKACVPDGKGGCKAVEDCPVYYMDKERKKPVTGRCYPTPGECNCLYIVR
jgi:hypothetical protein